jgi:hypothetical protein
MTFVGGLRHDGIMAPWVIGGPISGESFCTCVEQVLVPELRPDDIVVMDNLGSHKGPAIRHASRAAGAKLFYLPACSPDLNQIAQVISTPSTCSAKPQNAPRRPSGAGSDRSSTSSPRRHAKTAPEMPEAVPCRAILL